MPASLLSPSFGPVSRAAAAALFLSMALSACGDSSKGAQGGGAGGAPGGAMPPPQVGVVKVQPASVGLTTELPGRVEALRVAQVRARAAGILQKRLFQEGSDVKAGQVLFQIDPAPYQAALQSAQATLARAQANLAQSSATARWWRPMPSASRNSSTR